MINRSASLCTAAANLVLTLLGIIYRHYSAALYTTIAIGALTLIGAIYRRYNAQFTQLNLSCQGLTRAPDFSNLQLISLSLAFNHLTHPPDVSNNPELRALNLSFNQLTELHDSVLSLPRSCVVRAERNRFSAAYIEAFQARLQAHRLAHPDQGPTVYLSIHDDHAPARAAAVSLEERLTFWNTAFQAAFPRTEHADLWASRPVIEENLAEHFAPLLSLDEDTKTLLANYLRRLQDTQDYRSGGAARNNVILRVDRMLQLATANREFKDAMLALVNEGLQSCGDRVLIIFNEIEILWQLHQNLTREEFRFLAIRAQRYEELKKYAQRECDRLGLGDAIETILYFHLHLKTDLDLPISTEGMLYPGMAGVTDEMLNAARGAIGALSPKQLLARSAHWEAFIRGQHQREVDSIHERFADLLGVAEGYFQSDEKEQFLQEHPELRPILEKAPNKNDYNALALFIDELRRQEISRLGY